MKIKAPYGYCPLCSLPGVMRERCPRGNDRCAVGHVYPSASALPAPLSVSSMPQAASSSTAYLMLALDVSVSPPKIFGCTTFSEDTPTGTDKVRYFTVLERKGVDFGHAVECVESALDLPYYQWAKPLYRRRG